MKNIIKSTNRDLIKLPIIKLFAILLIHFLIVNSIPGNIIFKLLVTIPLTSGYSYIIYRSFLNLNISIKDMFLGYKFCIRSIYMFLIIEAARTISSFAILCNVNTFNPSVEKVIMMIVAISLYYLTFRTSFLRYYSMRAYHTNTRPKSFSTIVKNSLQLSKGYIIPYFLINFTLYTIFSLFNNIIITLFNPGNGAIAIYLLTTTTFTRLYEEVFRINILKENSYEFIA